MGRSGYANVELADPEVSRRHARIDLVRGVLYLADEGSSNGTFLNGKPLGDESIELRPGDDIDVGNTRITISGMEPVR
jgi:pSer/pThr/pTyr-binding forkhead associated (FHA) protein